MGAVANSIGLQAVVGDIARLGDADFDPRHTLSIIAELAKGFAGARGVGVEQIRADAALEVLVNVGEITGTPRRLSLNSEGMEIGFLAIYGAPMFGPATAERTQILVDLAAITLSRAIAIADHARPGAEDARYRLINGVGHNLRNTLGAASGYIQLVELEGTLTESQQEYVSRSRRAINAAVSLIGDLLDVTRADAGKVEFSYEAIDVNAMVGYTAHGHISAAQAKRCDLELFSSDRNPVINSDRTYVQQILDVLIYNAVRYTPPDSRVTVTVETREGRRSTDPGDWVCVCVRDSGGGVAETQKVFEELHRVEHSKGNIRFKLAICRRIARLLGGDMTLDVEKNVGSTFTLWLPADAAPVAEAVEAVPAT